MSPEKLSARLLIIDTDVPLAEALAQYFTAEGYQVFLASSSWEGLTLAQKQHPSLILLASRMDKISGLETLRALRDTARTAHIPVMVMAGHSELGLQNKILEEGAYDFIEKPLDLDILALRVRNALRRAEREGLTEPRTGLPTGRLIRERLDTLDSELGWYRIDLKIDGFGTFRDLYGFVTANEALRFAGNLILQLVNEYGGAEDFVGHHNNTEEFVIITTPTQGFTLRDRLAPRIDSEMLSFYNFMEREQGYILLEDGAGGNVKKLLMSAHISTCQGEPDPDAPPDPWVDAEEDAPNSQGSADDAPSSAFEW